jgi:hypothetical protein
MAGCVDSSRGDKTKKLAAGQSIDGKGQAYVPHATEKISCVPGEIYLSFTKIFF